MSDAERIAALRERLAERPPPAPGLIRRLPYRRARVIGTRLAAPWSRRRLRAAAERSPLRLHLGSGRVNKEGWVNIDLLAARADVAWDLETGVPFASDSVDAIFHEHMLEHLDLHAGFAFARECLRVLKPGGVLRVAVPDAGALLRSYAGTGDPGWARSQATPMLAVDALFYEHDHRAMYDGETLVLLLRAAGFGEASESRFGEGRLQPSPDSPVRRDGTLYVEATKL